MGVHGITQFLEDKGILPSRSTDCCCPKLWQEWQSSMAFREVNIIPSLHIIPPKSKLLIDGNGLVFHLYQIAYSRHMKSTFPSCTSGSCPKIKSLNSTDIAKAIPCMMPLTLVRQVTDEFVATLCQQDLKLQCFWDGPARAFKSKTLQKRDIQREQEWAALQTFCTDGTLHMKPTETVCGCIRQFPFSRLFLLSVKQALQSHSIHMVQCDDEADIALAREATGDPDAFVLGQDSDFLFYKDIQYIPFRGIYMPLTTTPNFRIQAVCLTRSNVADALGLDDEDMVELAILLGNDYIDPMTLDVPTDLRNITDRITYLQMKCKEHYQVQSKDKSTQVLQYVRSLYNLQDDMESFLDSNEDLDGSAESGSAEMDPMDALEERVISFPDDFPLDQAVVLPTDNSVRGAVVRSLLAYINQSAGEENAEMLVLKKAHVTAYQEATMPSISRTPFQLTERPKWENVCAAFVIEICITRTLRASGNMLLTKQTPLDVLMNHLHFHASMPTLQEEKEIDDRGDATNTEPTTQAIHTVERPILPIDDHEEKIIETIQANRVTIIHGETGCGKSSRVPVMILEAPCPEPSLPQVKMFISQPRRIAAASLVERVRSCEPKHRQKFALRMGHGHREYESNQTQAWFVTTGYLTRLLANHPERFNNVTHLVIDEVHERSVDTDILCLLCRRLLESNTRIRLVLMSATMATKLYKDYFKVPGDPIHVGVRRFPIKEFFVEDLDAKFKLPPNEQKAAQAIQKECESKRCNSSPTSAEISKRFSLAARLTTIVGNPGSSVLIFVPGMGEIIAITEAIEKFYRAGVTYKCYPIHSDVPFEDQMGAFVPPGADEVKIIIATNAAESSVTLPAVDHVICLGLCRQIMYNEASHRQILMSCWISRASATQRAGRTGRLRPGNVYRLYTRVAYEKYMDEFEQGEMVRIPLDSVILMLKEMMHEQAKPVLLDCIEPPRMETIDKSFQSLHDWKFLSEPNDDGEITNLGSFVSALGIDLALGFFIGLGIQFGVAAEAIEMAAIMSFPKSPFQISNPLIHEPAMYNDIISRVYVSKCHFDANLYSEPLALMNALWDYHVAPDKQSWCNFYRFSNARMRQLYTTRNSLRKRVAEFLGINEIKLQVESPPVHMPHYKTTILRVLKVWVFSDAIIECRPPKVARSPDGSVTVVLPQKQVILEEHLSQILTKDRHPYRFSLNQIIDGLGIFDVGEGGFSLLHSINELQCRLVSYMCEIGIDVAALEQGNHLFIFINGEKEDRPTLAKMIEMGLESGESQLLTGEYGAGLKRRGMLERKCGLWKVSSTRNETYESLSDDDGGRKKRFFRRLSHCSDGSSLLDLVSQSLKEDEITSTLYLRFPEGPNEGKKKKKKHKLQHNEFHYFLKGTCHPISKVDLQDLLAALSVTISKTTTRTSQAINFLYHEKKPLLYPKKGAALFASSINSDLSSWERPFFVDTPEGARILSVFASGNHRGAARVKFADDKEDDEDASTTIFFDAAEMSIGERWYRFGTDQRIYVDKTTVAASATNCDFPLIACCANSLELKGGGLRVDGMTLLPPNPLFLLLCRLSFGLGANINLNFRSIPGGRSRATSDPAKDALNWLNTRLELMKTKTIETGIPGNSVDVHANGKDRIEMAIDFHQSCANMGEALVCFPDKVKALCKIFDGVDGYNSSPDETIDERGLTMGNLNVWRLERKAHLKISPVETPRQSPSYKSSASISTTLQLPKRSISPVEQKAPAHAVKCTTEWQIVRTFEKETLDNARRLFATTLDDGQQLSQSDFPSTNILAILIKEVADALTTSGAKKFKPKQGSVNLDTTNWEIIVHKKEDGQLLYHAKFKNTLLPMTPLFGRGKNKLPKWMKKDVRPKLIKDVRACVPPKITVPEPIAVHLSTERQVLAFETIDSALRMEAAFYLERQLAVAGKNSFRHWFEHGLTEMVQILLKTIQS